MIKRRHVCETQPCFPLRHFSPNKIRKKAQVTQELRSGAWSTACGQSNPLGVDEDLTSAINRRIHVGDRDK
jgi:hypothetical protein